MALVRRIGGLERGQANLSEPAWCSIRRRNTEDEVFLDEPATGYGGGRFSSHEPETFGLGDCALGFQHGSGDIA
ncbi:hypothetical protein GCM10022254_11580 [Actinomadura meridiana]|uniref:Uncharacterized protein n=1 Tax=Actinomadura meridiana TaxID=559626 RepID=A0ABP8BUE4_9ACTN